MDLIANIQPRCPKGMAWGRLAAMLTVACALFDDPIAQTVVLMKYVNDVFDVRPSTLVMSSSFDAEHPRVSSHRWSLE